MVGGKIFDFYQLAHIEDDAIVRFLVQGDGCEKNDFCCVRAAIPLVVYPELAPGQPIWWHSNTVFLKVYGVEDAKFNKIGFSGGDQFTFYEKRPKNIIDKVAPEKVAAILQRI